MTKNTKRMPIVMPLIEKAIGDAGEKGLTLDAMRGLFPGYCPYQINRSANKLDAQGRCFKSSRGHANSCAGVRWFLVKDWAEAFAALPATTRGAKRQRSTATKRNDHAYSQMLYRRRMAEEKDADRKASNQLGPAIVTEKTRITVAPPKPERWQVEVPTSGGFSHLKPGQYAFEAASCAARATE